MNAFACLKPFSLFVAFVTLSACSTTVAQTGHVPEHTPGEPFTFADLQRLRIVEDVELSPDGKMVAYTVSSTDLQQDRPVESLWVLRTTGKEDTPVELPGAFAPAWSPSSRQLAVVKQGKDGRSTVQLLRADTLRTIRSFPLPSSPGSLLWSPDGKSIAFTLFVPEPANESFLQKAVDAADGALSKPAGAQWAPPVQLTQAARYRRDGGHWLAPGHTHLFVLSTESGGVHALGTGPFDESDPAWTPDSASLLFTSDRRPERDHVNLRLSIYKTDLAGHIMQLTQGEGTCYAPAASPDGKWIAYTAMPYRAVNYTRNDLFVMRADGSGSHQLATGLDRDLFAPQWTADSRVVYAQYADHGVSRLGSFGLDGVDHEVVRDLGGAFSIAADGTVAYAGKSATQPDELRLQRPVGKLQTLTSLNDFLHERTLGRLVHLESRSEADGVPVEGWALLPAGASEQTKLPMILALHGGPFGADGPNWSSRFQLFAAAGYAVVDVNYRGSTSYGASFSEPANHDFPGLAYDDVMSIVDEAVRQGIADPDRLFVTGGSAGGQLTAWITGRTKRFRAAVAEKPVINLMSDALTTDQYLAGPDIYEGNPWTHELDLWKHSPLSLVGSMTTPMLVIVGEQDFRTPLEQALQLYDALKLQGVPAALMRVPGAGHESLASRPSQLAAETAATLAWFGNHGRPDSTP